MKKFDPDETFIGSEVFLFFKSQEAFRVWKVKIIDITKTHFITKDNKFDYKGIANTKEYNIKQWIENPNKRNTERYIRYTLQKKMLQLKGIANEIYQLLDSEDKTNMEKTLKFEKMLMYKGIKNE
jgi:hypothetical protein